MTIRLRPDLPEPIPISAIILARVLLVKLVFMERWRRNVEEICKSRATN